MENNLYTPESAQKLFAYILKSGLKSEKFKTESNHYITPLSTKKENADLDRAIKNIVVAVDNLIKNPNSIKDQQAYETNSAILFTFANKYKAPDIYSVLMNCSFVNNSPNYHQLLKITINAYKETLASLEPDSRQFKECSLDLSRCLAIKLTIGFLTNYHPYKSSVNEFLDSVPNSPEGMKILDKVANMFSSCQNSAVASKIYEKLYSLDHSTKTLAKLIDAYHRSENFDKAEAHILALLKKDPHDENAIDLLTVNCVGAERDYDLAISYIENIDKSNPLYYKDLAYIKFDQDKTEEALHILDEGALLGFEKELSLDYANIYYHKHNYSNAIKYFKFTRENSPYNHLVEADYALSLMRNKDYDKAFEVFCSILDEEPHTLPTLSSYINAMQSCLYAYGDEFVNITNRGDKNVLFNIQNKYLEKTKLFEESLKSIISLNYAEKAKAYEVIKQTQEVLHPTINRHLLPKDSTSAELTLDNLGYVFSRWLDDPLVKKIFTPPEIEQLKFDIGMAIANKDNPHFSFAGCASNINILVEKYVEPIYYYYLLERIGTLNRKSARYEKLKNNTLELLRQKSNEKNQLLAKRQDVPAELKEEITALTDTCIRYSQKEEKLTHKLKEMKEFRDIHFNLGHLYFLTTIVSKEKIDAQKQQEQPDEESPNMFRILNPAFGKFLDMHTPQDETDKRLFALILQSNIEAFRLFRNDAVHANIDCDMQVDKNDLDEDDNPNRTWNCLNENAFVKADTFLNLLIIALFSSNSIFNYINDVNIEFTFADKTAAFFNQNSNSARNATLEK